MAPHSITLAWKIPWTEEPSRLQSMGSRRVRHDRATSLSLFLSCIGEGNGNPLQCSCLENPRDEGAWWAAIYGVAQSRTRLKQLKQQQQPSCLEDVFSLYFLNKFELQHGSVRERRVIAQTVQELRHAEGFNICRFKFLWWWDRTKKITHFPNKTTSWSVLYWPDPTRQAFCCAEKYRSQWTECSLPYQRVYVLSMLLVDR